MKLEVKDLTLAYGENKLFENLSFSTEGGDILGILGKNGSGKTSLCKRLAAIPSLNLVSGGSVSVDGKEVTEMTTAERCKKIAIIFQEPETQLFSPRVEDELSFAPENLCVEREKIKKRLNFVYSLLGAEHLRNAKTNGLSGGEKQLIAIASAVTSFPEIIIADEITARLDKNTAERVLEALKAFAENGGIVIIVSHIEDSLKICNKTVRL